jgi:hypothetical protein
MVYCFAHKFISSKLQLGIAKGKSLTASPLLEDINAAMFALEQDDYQNMNIFANRVMSNATIESDNKFLLIGFFLKDVAVEMTELGAAKVPTALATAKARMTMFASKMKEHANRKDFAEDEIWKEYVNHSDAVRKFHFTVAEEKSYSDHKDFTRKVGSWVIEMLKNDRNVLLEPKNLFLKGLSNELARSYRMHGADRREIVLLSLLTAIDRFYDYVLLELEGPDGSLNQDRVKADVFPYLDQICQVVEAEDLSKTDNLMAQLIIQWRLRFVRYMERVRVVRATVEKGVQLPEEMKKKIGEAVTKALDVKEKTK